MSSQVFPSLPSLDVRVTCTVIHKTLVQQTESGQELRVRRWPGPKYRYELKFNGLRQNIGNAAQDEVALLRTFILAHGGAWDSFLFTDPVDGTQRRVRIEDDDVSFERTVKGVWAVGSLSLITTSVDYGTYPEPPVIDPSTGTGIVVNGTDGSIWLMSLGNDEALVTTPVITEEGGRGVDVVLQAAGGTKYLVQVDAEGRLDPQVYVGATAVRTLSLKSPNQKAWNITVGDDGAINPVEGA